MIDDTFGSSNRCDRCEHGATLHGYDGCNVFRCTCHETKARVLEAASGNAFAEHHAKLRAWNVAFTD